MCVLRVTSQLLRVIFFIVEMFEFRSDKFSLKFHKDRPDSFVLREIILQQREIISMLGPDCDTSDSNLVYDSV